MKKSWDKAPASAGHRIGTVIGTALCMILIPILILNSTLLIKSCTHSDQVPSIGGIFPMIILTDSMEPEFSSGDLIICRSADAEEVRTGDIICFYDPAGDGTTTVTHRVSAVTTDTEGSLAWETRGDANHTEDPDLVPAEKLVGIYRCRIADLGKAAMFVQSPRGMIVCIFCPIILWGIYDMVRRSIYEKAKKKDTDALLEELSKLRAEKEKRVNGGI